MKKKALYVATVDKGHILKFHIPYLKLLKERGFEVHVACAGDAEIPYCDKKHELPFERSPFKMSNIIAYKELKKIVRENKYSLIHCHTPVGGVVGRLAAKEAKKNGTKVFYTAHGFHFFKNAPIINWAFFYPIEKMLANYTDCLITINDEDYQNAIQRGFKANSIKKVNGVGIDLNKFVQQTTDKKNQIREQYGYNKNEFILVYPAELNKNKHQDLLLNAVSKLKKNIPNIKLLLAGEGVLFETYKDQVSELAIENNVEFLGFRKDISNLLMLSDVAVASSRREGLAVNIMEAMATGLPLVVTNCRGQRDLVSNNKNGFVIDLDDVDGFASAVERLYFSEELRKKFGSNSKELAQAYSLEFVLEEVENIYKEQQLY